MSILLVQLSIATLIAGTNCAAQEALLASNLYTLNNRSWQEVPTPGDYSHFGTLVSGFNIEDGKRKWQHNFVQYHGYQHTMRRLDPKGNLETGAFPNQSETTSLNFGFRPGTSQSFFDLKGISTVASMIDSHHAEGGGECRGAAAGFFVNREGEPVLISTVTCIDYVRKLAKTFVLYSQDGGKTWRGKKNPHGDDFNLVNSAGRSIFSGLVDRTSIGSMFVTYGTIKQSLDRSKLYLSAYIGVINMMFESRDQGTSWTGKVIACGVDKLRTGALSEEAAYIQCGKFASAFGQRKSTLALQVDYPILSGVDLSELAIQEIAPGKFVSIARIDGSAERYALSVLASKNGGRSWMELGRQKLVDEEGRALFGNISPYTTLWKNMASNKTYIVTSVSRRDSEAKSSSLQLYAIDANRLLARNPNIYIGKLKPTIVKSNIIRHEKAERCMRDDILISTSRHGYQGHWFHPRTGRGFIITQEEADDCHVKTYIQPINISRIINLK